LFHLDDQHVYRAESLEQFPWLEHGFGTRLSNGWPDVSRLVTPKQIHSNHVLVVPGGAPAGAVSRFGQGDALVSVQPEIMIGIRTADCLPIVLVGANPRSLGVIHAGWRGTVSEISVHAVRAMMCRFGTSPDQIWAAIGPGIGPCCFEVGPDVAVQFKGIFPERVDFHHRTHIDLAEANRRQLESSRVPSIQIEVSGLCTVCLANEFHSFRRDKEQAGRMISAVGQKAQKARA
jgi:YfiH family protein